MSFPPMFFARQPGVFAWFVFYAFAFFTAGFLSPILAGEMVADVMRWLPGVLSILIAFGVAVLTFHPRLRPQRLMDVGLVFMVVGSFGIAVAQYWGIYSQIPLDIEQAQGFGLSWVSVWMVCFVVVVPNYPTRTAIAILGAASTVPIVIGLSMKYGGSMMDVPPLGFFLVLVLPYWIVGVMAFGGARIVYRLGTDVTRAREMGSYRLETALGQGGMGEVWKAQHRMLARPAAIKLIRPEVLGSTDPETRNRALQRFEREAQATANMRSPHTIQLYDFGVTDEGTFYHVMELLDGFDTETLVQRFGVLPAERTVSFLKQVCHSLAEAHDRGLIHRDIKPANVFTCRYGREVDFIKVLDFGLVKTPTGPSEPAVQLTQDQAVGGTPAFVAPEQVLGDRPIDGRTDLYAVGCLGYWLLTGELVFSGETAMKLMMHHVNTEPIPPSHRTETPVPPGLEAVILACLEKDPDRRPPNADELMRRLEACSLPSDWTAERAHRWWEAHRPAREEGAPSTPTGKETQTV